MSPLVRLDECLMLVGGDASDSLAWSDPGLLQDRAGCGRSITGWAATSWLIFVPAMTGSVVAAPSAATIT
jgi:hypothetical protein